jgi:hypothetical protein
VGKLDLEHQALVDLTLGLRGLDLSAFMREVARRAREVLGVEFCEVLELLADRDHAALEPRTGGAAPPLRFCVGTNVLVPSRYFYC